MGYAPVVECGRNKPSLSAKVSACSARLRTASRSEPRGSDFASSRSRPACSARRSSRGFVCMERDRFWGNRIASASRCALFRVRRERHCLSVTESCHTWSGDELKLGVLSVGCEETAAHCLNLFKKKPPLGLAQRRLYATTRGDVLPRLIKPYWERISAPARPLSTSPTFRSTPSSDTAGSE